MSKFFASTGSLRPTVAQCTGRYEVGLKLQRQSALIEPGMFLSTRVAAPTYLPENWSAHIHPEGKIYFCRETGLSVVTENNMYDPVVREQICFWASVAEKEADSKGFALTNAVELFLQLNGEDCNYYFIDRATKALFWLEAYESCDIGLHNTISPSHLRIVLEAEYWTHTENFCMHFGGLHQKDIESLILVFSHALADNLTSSSSTFPFDAKACEKFLNLLTISRDRIHEGYTVSFVARLWSVVAYNRYETHFGQEQARLSREQSILVDENAEPKWVQRAISAITWRISVQYASRLNSLFLDNFVYGCDWDAFMTETVKGWGIVGAASAFLLFLHAFCFLLSVFPTLFYISASLSTLSILASALLIHKHQHLTNAGAGPGHDYLSTVCSPRIKFQGVAFAYALPKGFFLWGLLISLSQTVLILCQHIPLHYAILLGGVVVFTTLAIHFVTSDVPLGRPSLLPTSIFRTTKDEASMA